MRKTLRQRRNVLRGGINKYTARSSILLCIVISSILIMFLQEVGMDNRSGITLLEIVVVLFIIGVLYVALFPAISSHPMPVNMMAVGSRGKDIFVAITGANTEREAVGLPPIWPSDAPPYTNHVTGKVECFDFENSTDYFWYIYDGDNLGTEKHQPMVAGFDFSKLAGAGVSAHTGADPLKYLTPTKEVLPVGKTD